MMKKMKKNLAKTFVLIIAATILLTPLVAYAGFTQKTLVNGDGVRLRKTPGQTGIILELMYMGEPITLSDDVMPPSDLSAWVYLRREKTGTVGWMEGSYYLHDYEP